MDISRRGCAMRARLCCRNGNALIDVRSVSEKRLQTGPLLRSTLLTLYHLMCRLRVKHRDRPSTMIQSSRLELKNDSESEPQGGHKFRTNPGKNHPNKLWDHLGLTQGWESDCWRVLGIPSFAKLHFIAFDKYETRIQDFGKMFPGIFTISRCPSSKFQHLQIW